MTETTFSRPRPVSADFHKKFVQITVENLSSFKSFLAEHQGYRAFTNLLNLQFSNQDLFFQAFFHASFVNELSGVTLQSNERLEFLGDSVLGAVVASYLVKNYPTLSEGELSRFRGSIVNEESWSALGKELGLPQLVLMGKGESSSEINHSSAVICDLFEAIFGAIFLDGGYQKAEQFFLNVLSFYEKKHGTPYISLNLLNSFDAKSRLQELTMKRFKSLPEYKVRQIDQENFEVTLSIPQIDKVIARASSKKKASIEAAKIALEKLLNILQE